MNETVSHALRDCASVKALWKLLVHPKFWDCFFKYDMKGWIHYNAEGWEKGMVCVGRVFSITIWYIWNNYNKMVFCNGLKDASMIFWRINALTSELISDNNLTKFTNSFKRDILVKWTFPEHEWVKGNVDDSCKNRGNTTSCGGVFCDAASSCIFGLSKLLGGTDALNANMWWVFLSLGLSWSGGFRRV